jgi:hypothetical protein
MSTIEFFTFATSKPPERGYYLWALNNWRSANFKQEPILTYDCSSAYWNGKGWAAGAGGIIDPDQWAYLPMPEKKDQP